MPGPLRDRLIEALASADNQTEFKYAEISKFEPIMRKYGALADAVLAVLSEREHRFGAL